MIENVIYPKIITMTDIEHEQALAAVHHAQSNKKTAIGLTLRDLKFIGRRMIKCLIN